MTAGAAVGASPSINPEIRPQVLEWAGAIDRPRRSLIHLL